MGWNVSKISIDALKHTRTQVVNYLDRLMDNFSALVLPSDSTEATKGAIRYNTTYDVTEIYNGSAWVPASIFAVTWSRSNCTVQNLYYNGCAGTHNRYYPGGKIYPIAMDITRSSTGSNDPVYTFMVNDVATSLTVTVAAGVNYGHGTIALGAEEVDASANDHCEVKLTDLDGGVNEDSHATVWFARSLV